MTSHKNSEENPEKKDKRAVIISQPTTASPVPYIPTRRKLTRFFLISVLATFLTTSLSYASTHLPFSIVKQTPTTMSTFHFKPLETADLMARYYELLADMHYYPRSYIKYPPHSPAISLELCEKYELERQVVELLQLLPYVEGYNNEDEFILWGSFADYRDEGVFEQARDPTFASPDGGWEDENGLYMRPWVVALTECGNHGTVVYLDTHSGNISMANQLDSASADPFFEGYEYPEEQPKNRNSIANLPSRPAKEVLEDFMGRLRNLEWIPYMQWGYPRIARDSDDEYPELKLIFQTYGWPDNFKDLEFDAAMERYNEFCTIRFDALDPQRRVREAKERYEHMVEYTKNLLDRYDPSTKVWDHNPNKSPEEIWKVEEESRMAKEVLERQEKEIAEMEKGVLGWEGNELEIGKMWKKELEKRVESGEDELRFWTGEGKTKVESDAWVVAEMESGIKVAQEQIRVARERLERWEDEPRTVWQAIRPRE